MNAGSLQQQLLQRQKDKEGKHRASLRQRNWKQNENKNQFSWTESGQARNKGSEDKARNDRLARLISVVRKSLDATEGERKGLKKSVKTRRELIVKPDMLLQHLQLDQYISHCCPYRKGFSSQHRLLEINDNYSLWAIAFSLTTEPHRWDLKTTLNFLFFYSPVLIFAYSCSGLTPLGQDFKISPLAPDPPAPCDPGKLLGESYVHSAMDALGHKPSTSHRPALLMRTREATQHEHNTTPQKSCPKLFRAICM